MYTQLVVLARLGDQIAEPPAVAVREEDRPLMIATERRVVDAAGLARNALLNLCRACQLGRSCAAEGRRMSGRNVQDARHVRTKLKPVRN